MAHEYSEDKNYYVISPNVLRDGNFTHLRQYMKKHKCVLMGWSEDNAKGQQFVNMQKGDCVLQCND